MNIQTLRRPWGLRLLLPVFKLMRRIAPSSFAARDDVLVRCNASAMLTRGNWLYRLIFPRFFAKMRYEVPADIKLADYADDGTLVYMCTRVHELEYNTFSHVFAKLGLPLAHYANGFSLRRWMRWADLKETLCCQFSAMADYGGLPHPAKSGRLADMIAAGSSVLYSLAPAELQEESEILSESHQLIVAAVQAHKKSRRPVYLVPVNFIWDRRPRKSGRSLVDILFGEREQPGILRKMILFWRNYKRRALVQIGNPIDLRAYKIERPAAADEELATHIRTRLIDVLQAERRAITGPPIREQGWFVDHVLEDPLLNDEMSRLAVERTRDPEHMTVLARRYAREIAANLNYTVIDTAARFLRWIFKNLFERISIDRTNLARLKELSIYTPLIFVPNHRSHVDYLLLSYLFYENNMIVPHIAAGINLSFWPLGAFFRRCGAFFIRRTFGGNKLYKAVMQTYLRILLTEGYHQEFFIEGGRTRTGRLRPARLGMLSMYMDAVVAGARKDLIFVPVSVTYDRVIEQREYVHELEGGSKKPEQARDVVGLTRFLRKQKERNGTIYVRFGMPVSAEAAAHELKLAPPITPEKKAVIVRLVADQLCREINRHTVVTPLSLTALALLLKPRRAVPVAELKRRVGAYLDYLAPKDIELSESLRQDRTRAIDDALSHFARARLIRFHDDPEFPFYELVEQRRIELDFYKNSILHYYASLAFLCMVLKKCLGLSHPCKIDDVGKSLEFLEALFQFEFRFNQSLPIAERMQPPLEFLIRRGALSLDENGTIRFGTEAYAVLDLFSGLVRNVVDSYRGALIMVKRHADEPVERRVLVKEMMDAGPKLFLMNFMSRREAISKENFTHALLSLRELGAISNVTRERDGKDVKLLAVYGREVERLQGELEKIT